MSRVKALLRSALVGAGYVTATVVGAVITLSERTRGRAEFAPECVRRILVIRLDLLGDVALTLPAVAALRLAYPRAHIALLALPYTEAIAKACADLDEVIAFDINRYRRPRTWLRGESYRELSRLVRRLRAGRYDLAISMHGYPASFLALLSGAPWRVGLSGHSYSFSVNLPVEGKRYTRGGHEVEYVLALAARAGATDRGARAQVKPEPAAAKAVDALLHSIGSDGDAPLVVIHAGATNGPAKRWRAERWAETARRLSDELGATVVLSGGAGDRALTQRISEQSRRSAHDLAGRTTLPELVALLARADLVLSGDSGPLHVAGALGTPRVALYGPTDPAVCGPWGEGAAVLRHTVACGPCYDLGGPAECRTGTLECMDAIGVDEVVAAACAALAART